MIYQRTPTPVPGRVCSPVKVHILITAEQAAHIHSAAAAAIILKARRLTMWTSFILLWCVSDLRSFEKHTRLDAASTQFAQRLCHNVCVHILVRELFSSNETLMIADCSVCQSTDKNCVCSLLRKHSLITLRAPIAQRINFIVLLLIVVGPRSHAVWEAKGYILRSFIDPTKWDEKCKATFFVRYDKNAPDIMLRCYFWVCWQQMK